MTGQKRQRVDDTDKKEVKDEGTDVSKTTSKMSGTTSKVSETTDKVSGTTSKVSETTGKESGTTSKVSETTSKVSETTSCQMESLSLSSLVEEARLLRNLTELESWAVWMSAQGKMLSLEQRWIQEWKEGEELVDYGLLLKPMTRLDSREDVRGSFSLRYFFSSSSFSSSSSFVFSFLLLIFFLYLF